MAQIGRASVKVTPDLSTFRKDLTAQLKAIKAEITVNVKANITKAKAEVDAFAKNDVTKNVKLDVDKGAFKGLTSTLGNIGTTIARTSVAFSSMVSTGQALGPLLAAAAGSAALIPAALLGGVGVLAAFKLGADGIKKAFEGLTPALNTLKSQISASFEHGLAPGVQKLAQVLPKLQVGLQSIAKAASGAFTQIANMLNSNGKAAQLNEIFIGTSMVVQNLGKAFAPILSGLISIGEIGIPLFNQFTKGAGAAAQAFADWANSDEGGDAIEKAISGAISAFKTLHAILQQVVGIVANVITGLTRDAGSLGGALLPALTAINHFLGSDLGQSTLATLGDALKTIGGVVSTVLTEAFKQAAPAIIAILPAIKQLAQQLGVVLVQGLKIVGPILTGLFGFLANNIGWIGPAAIGIAAIVAAVKAWSIAQTLLNAIITANPFVAIAAVIIAIVAIVIANWDTVKTFFQALWIAIKTIFQIAWDAIKGFFLDAWNNLVTVWTVVSGFFAGLWNAVTAVISSAWDSIKGFFQGAWDFLVGVWNAVTGFFQNLWNGVVAGVQNLGNSVKNAFSTAWNFVKSVWNAVTGFFSNVWRGITSSLSGTLNTVKGWFSDAWNFIKRVFSGVGNFFSNVWSGITNGLKGIVNGAIRLLNGLITAANYIPGVNISKIPYLARGGTAEAGKPHIVGENGPEVFVPGQTGRVVDNRNTVAALGAVSSGGSSGVTVDDIVAAFSRVRFTIDNTGLARITTVGAGINSRR